MGFIIKTVLLLAVLGFAALAGFAYLGDMAPPQGEISNPVTLDVD